LSPRTLELQFFKVHADPADNTTLFITRTLGIRGQPPTLGGCCLLNLFSKVQVSEDSLVMASLCPHITLEAVTSSTSSQRFRLVRSPRDGLTHP